VQPEEQIQKLLDAFEVNDILRLRQVFLDDFFKGKEQLNRNEFNAKFGQNQFEWIFIPEGIRFMLEKNNDVKPPQESD